jgi:hypothetical protein
VDALFGDLDAAIGTVDDQITGFPSLSYGEFTRGSAIVDNSGFEQLHVAGLLAIDLTARASRLIAILI